MNSRAPKDTSDERDEPFASEDEIEHEDDSVDVEAWKRKRDIWRVEEDRTRG